MTQPNELWTYRKQAMGLVLELQTNRATLEKMLDWYDVFAFTGGDVPRGRYSLVGITSYLEQPFATERIPTEEVERYENTVEVLVGLGQGAAAGPRTLRCRHDMADAFGRVSADIKALGSTLELALTEVLNDPE